MNTHDRLSFMITKECLILAVKEIGEMDNSNLKVKQIIQFRILT